MILTGDCIALMEAMEPDHFDAIVTDPPYGIEFMGKDWDTPKTLTGHATWGGRENEAMGVGKTHPRGFANVDRTKMQHWHEVWAAAALRVAKPSAYMLVFGGTRVVHRMTCAIEDAGWEIRDMLCWVYAQGFPKSKSSLKPAWEPIILARKPGPLGPLQIDAARLPTEDALGGGDEKRVSVEGKIEGWSRPWMSDPDAVEAHAERIRANVVNAEALGRWPANVVLTDDVFAPGIEGVEGGRNDKAGIAVNRNRDSGSGGYGGWAKGDGEDVGFGDSGSYSRYFLVPKASRKDREPTGDAAYCTCETVKPWVSEAQPPPDQTATTSPPRDTSEAPSMDDSGSSTMSSGSEPTEPSQPDTRSTTSTETSDTTTSPTFDSSIPSPTSASTPDASSGMASGGSPADPAGSPSPSTPTTGTSAPKAGRSTVAADRATSPRSSSPVVCAVCGGWRTSDVEGGGARRGARINAHPT